MLAVLTQKRIITTDLFVLRLEAPSISHSAIAGQFVNVLPNIHSIDPLLRRPFSIYQRDKDWIEIIIQTHGKGTAELSRASVGSQVDLIGPLGSPWNFKSEYSEAILVVGGVGVASMPLLTQELKKDHTKFFTYYGARSAALFADEYLENITYATDDGSKGRAGNVIDCLRADLAAGHFIAPKLFVCGPTPMMRAAALLAKEFSIDCEISLETEMACGVGICQGCPVRTTPNEKTTTGRDFHLVCTQGPSFEAERIVF